MTRMLSFAAAAALLAAVPAAAAPSMTNCGNAGTGHAGLGVIMVRAAGVKCATARAVARASDGKSATVKGVRWSCRITKEATGTEPGYNPYTHVSCRRGTSALVRFRWAS